MNLNLIKNLFLSTSFKNKIIIVFTTFILLFAGYKYTTYQSGYCPATKKLISDAEYISLALKTLRGEAIYYGGIDKFEEELIGRKKHPGFAGRAFNPNDPNCCKVLRGRENTIPGCNDYSVCVIFNFPTFKDMSQQGELYDREEGRTYGFDDCGKILKIWGVN